MHSPWILPYGFGSDTRIVKFSFCSGRTKCVTQLTWLSALWSCSYILKYVDKPGAKSIRYIMVTNKHSKRIDPRHHMIQDGGTKCTSRLECVSSDNNGTDVMTEVLDK